MDDAEFERAYGGKERRDWVESQPSIVDGARPCVNAHTRTGGTSRKADAIWIVPLTRAQHDELHQHGAATFEQKYGVNLDLCAVEIEARWQRYLSTSVRPAW